MTTFSNPRRPLHLVADELDQPPPGQDRVDRRGDRRSRERRRDRRLRRLGACGAHRGAAAASAPPLPPERRAWCSDPRRWGSRISRSASSGRSARARVISSKSTVAGTSASSKIGPVRHQPRLADPPRSSRRERPCRPRTRPAGTARHTPRARRRCPERSAPSAPRLVGRPSASPIRTDAARRAGAGHQDELSAVQRREHRRERVPGVLADEDRRPTPAGVERLHAPPRLDEALLVEHAVGRQEDLAMHVPDPGLGAAQRGVEPGVVESVAGAARRSRARRRTEGPWRRDAGGRGRRTAGRRDSARSRTPPSRK